MTAIAITRTDMTAVELRAAAGREKDGCAARRMLALAMVFEGVDRASAATRPDRPEAAILAKLENVPRMCSVRLTCSGAVE